MLELLTANWVGIAVAIALALLGYNHWDDIKAKIGGTKTKVSDDLQTMHMNITDMKIDGLSDLVDSIANLKVVKDLGVIRSDIVRTVLLGSVIRLRNYVETAATKEEQKEGLEACQTLGKILISGHATPDVPLVNPAIMQRRAVM